MASNHTLAHIVIKVSIPRYLLPPLTYNLITIIPYLLFKQMKPFCISAFSEASACGKHIKKHNIKNDQTADNEK